jgi:hypothetical protein
MTTSTATTLCKFQLPAKVLLSILAINLCLGMSDRASAIPTTWRSGRLSLRQFATPIPTTTPTTTPIPIPIPIPTTTPSGPICANVNINIQNRTPDLVKINQLEFLDSDTNTFLPTNIAQQQLPSGTGHQVTRDLAGLGKNERTKFRVTYQHKQGANSFAAPVSETTDRFVCVDGSTHRILLNK